MIQTKHSNVYTILLLIVAIFIAFTAGAQCKNFFLKCNNNNISADLKDVNLKDVLDEIKSRKGIWCEGETELLKKNITLKFDDLSLAEGIKRLLRSYNHALIYNKKGELNGIVIIDGSGAESTEEIVVDRPMAPEPQKGDHIMPPIGDNTLPPLGENITPPLPEKSVPTVSKKDAILPPKGNQLPPAVSREVLEKLKTNSQAPPLPKGLPE